MDHNLQADRIIFLQNQNSKTVSSSYYRKFGSHVSRDEKARGRAGCLYVRNPKWPRLEVSERYTCLQYFAAAVHFSPHGLCP